MKQILKSVILAAFAVALFYGCSKSPTKSPDGKERDTDGPVLTLDTLRDANRVLTLSDSTTKDSVYLKGRVSDLSGVKTVLVQASGDLNVANVSGSLWSVFMFLRSGANTITVTAADYQGNETVASASIRYIADYMPLTDSSYWKFQGTVASDSVSFRVDSIASIIGNRKLFKLNISNGLRGDTNIYVLLFQNVLRMHSNPDSLLDSQDTLFLKQYLPATTGYEGNTVTFVGDTLIGAATVRNCVKIVYPTQKAIKYITELVLSPNKGLVAIMANAFGGYALTARH